MNLERASLNNRIAYFIGAFHSDGTFYIFKDKKRNRDRYRIRFQVGEKSLPMLQYLQEIINAEFNRNLKIYLEGINCYGTRIYTLGMEVKALLPHFALLGVDKNLIPKAICANKRLFCSYLAGLIDGDGDIRIKRPNYPQCEIRITSGKPKHTLLRLIRFHLGCSARLEQVSVNSVIEGRQVIGHGYKQCFYLSSKNISDFNRYILPYLKIKHKRKIARKFIKMKTKPNPSALVIVNNSAY